MNTPLGTSSSQAPSLIHGRLSFSQLLLILCYIHLRSCLPSTVGDYRQLHDLLCRQDRDWVPCIGGEELSEMKQKHWCTTDQTTQRVWEQIRKWTLPQNVFPPGISAAELRSHLCSLLCRIEQISAQGLNALQTRRDACSVPGAPLGSRGGLTLLCMSVSVFSIPCEITTFGFMEDPCAVRLMLKHLQQSPLFPDVVYPHQLKSALDSLELLLCGGDDLISSLSRTNTPGYYKSTRSAYEAQLHRYRQDSRVQGTYAVLQYQLTEHCEGTYGTLVPKKRRKLPTPRGTNDRGHGKRCSSD